MTKRGRRFLIAGIVLLIGLWGVLDISREEQASGDALARIESDKTIRAAYFIGAPLFMVDPVTHQKTGIFHDALEDLAARLGWHVVWTEEVGYGQMIEGLAAHRYDIVGSGVWITPERAAVASFSYPLFFDTVDAYVRQDDPRFGDDLSGLNAPDYTISVMDGEIGARLAAEDFPLARTLSLPQQADFTQLIQNVLTKKADIVFLSRGAALDFMSKNPGLLRKPSQRPLRVFGNALMLAKNEPALRARLNGALAERQLAGEMEKILRRYEPYPGTYMRAPSDDLRTRLP